jgi:hypothetical protein
MSLAVITRVLVNPAQPLQQEQAAPQSAQPMAHRQSFTPSVARSLAVLVVLAQALLLVAAVAAAALVVHQLWAAQARLAALQRDSAAAVVVLPTTVPPATRRPSQVPPAALVGLASVLRMAAGLDHPAQPATVRTASAAKAAAAVLDQRLRPAR